MSTNADTKDAIVAAGRKAFSQRGYHQASVQEIIEATGMAKGSFYNYFQSKRELFGYIQEEFVQDVIGRVESVPLERIVDETSYEQVGFELAASLAELFLRDADLARIFFWESMGLDEASNRIIDEAYQRVTLVTTRYIERGIEACIVKPGIHPEIAAAAMVGMCSHLISRFLRGDFASVSPDELIASAVTLNLRGVLG